MGESREGRVDGNGRSGKWMCSNYGRIIVNCIEEMRIEGLLEY